VWLAGEGPPLRRTSLGVRTGFGGPVVRLLKSLTFPESDRRDPQLPAEVPFIPGLSCRVSYLTPPTFGVEWPAEPLSHPGLAEELRALLPAPPVIFEHPRKFLPVVEQVAAILGRTYPDDSRLSTLAALAAEAAQRATWPHPHGDRTILMPSASMDRFWIVFYALGTPSSLVERLEAAFDAMVRELTDGGWVPGETDNRYRPLFRYDRWVFLASGMDRRAVHYLATGSLHLYGSADA